MALYTEIATWLGSVVNVSYEKLVVSLGCIKNVQPNKIRSFNVLEASAGDHIVKKGRMNQIFCWSDQRD